MIDIRDPVNMLQQPDTALPQQDVAIRVEMLESYNRCEMVCARYSFYGKSVVSKKIGAERNISGGR